MKYHRKEVMQRTGIKKDSLLRLEKAGLISVEKERDEDGIEKKYRLYDDADIEKIEFIMMLKDLGYTKEQIALMMGDNDISREAMVEAYSAIRSEIEQLNSKLKMLLLLFYHSFAPSKPFEMLKEANDQRKEPMPIVDSYFQIKEQMSTTIDNKDLPGDLNDVLYSDVIVGILIELLAGVVAFYEFGAADIKTKKYVHQIFLFTLRKTNSFSSKEEYKRLKRDASTIKNTFSSIRDVLNDEGVKRLMLENTDEEHLKFVLEALSVVEEVLLNASVEE